MYGFGRVRLYNFFQLTDCHVSDTVQPSKVMKPQVYCDSESWVFYLYYIVCFIFRLWEEWVSMIGWVHPRRSMGLVQAHVHVHMLLLELKRLHVVVEMNLQVAPAGAYCVSDTKASCRDLVSGRCIVQWSLTLACYAMLQVYNAWDQTRIHG